MKIDKSFLRNFALSALMKMMRIYPINSKKVLFMSYYGKYYNDNPRAICEELHKNHPELELVWGLEQGVNHPDFVKAVHPSSLKFIKEMATAKVWIDNCRKREWVSKRKGQFYLQTWHGNLGNKKIEKAAIDKLSADYIRRAIKDGKNTDLMISGSQFFTNLCKTIFWYSGDILECGTPRLDVFFHFSEEDRARVFKTLKIDKKKKIILYAPTFRKNLSIESQIFDYNKLLEKLRQKYQEDFIFGIRFHPNINVNVSIFDNINVINLTDYPDLYELICVSEYVISDYSSLIFEAGLLDKPVFLYTPDLTEYEEERGGYWKYKELPFPLAETETELENLFDSFDYDSYIEKIHTFYNSLGIKEDGNATKRVVDVIYNIMQEEAQ